MTVMIGVDPAMITPAIHRGAAWLTHSPTPSKGKPTSRPTWSKKRGHKRALSAIEVCQCRCNGLICSEPASSAKPRSTTNSAA